MEVSVQRPTVTVEGLSENTAYEFHVYALNDVGRSITAASTVVTTRHTG